MNAIVFADDLMIWGCKEKEVQEQLNACEEVVEEYNMKSNIIKCEYMITTRELYNLLRS